MSDMVDDARAIEAILERIERRLDSIDRRMDNGFGLPSDGFHFDGFRSSLRSEMAGLRSDQRSQFPWLVATMMVVNIVLLVALAHGFHWL